MCSLEVAWGEGVKPPVAFEVLVIQFRFCMLSSWANCLGVLVKAVICAHDASSGPASPWLPAARREMGQTDLVRGLTSSHAASSPGS